MSHGNRRAWAIAALLLAVHGCGDDDADGAAVCSDGGSCVAADAGSAADAAPADGAVPRSDAGGPRTDAGAQTDDAGSGDAGGGDGSITPGPAPDGSVVGNPDGTWQNVTGSLAGLASECGNVSLVATDPSDGTVLVGILQQGFYASTDGARTWRKLGTGAGSAAILSGPLSLVFDPERVGTFWGSGLRGGGPGVYKTTDKGVTFEALMPGFQLVDSVGVDFTDAQRRTLLAGAHELQQTVHKSTDGGRTWANIGGTLPANSNHSSYVVVIDANTYLVGCAGWVQDAINGIFRTTNGGQSWTQVSSEGGGGFPLKASDGSIYWPERDRGGLYRSTDDGRSWQSVSGPGSVFSTRPVELPDGRIATRGPQGVMVSADHGTNWRVVAPREPFDDPFRLFPLAYSATDRAFYVTRWTCDPTAVPADAVVKFVWDYAND